MSLETIGLGAQYRVVDTRDGRVRKLPLSRDASLKVVGSWYPAGQAPADELAIDYPAHAAKAYRQIRLLLKAYPELGWSLGNPAFEPGRVFTQDKVQTLGDAFGHCTAEQAKSLVKAYSGLILCHWRYGISELSFNCTENCGVDAQGRVILLDFGEVTFEKEDATATISSRRWQRAASYTKYMPKHLQSFYMRHMGARISLKALAHNWQTALRDRSNQDAQ